jgi:hypothetical protein
VKTAISVPNETYRRASERARDMGMSRSEFFSRAAVRYLDELDSESITAEIDSIIADIGEPGDPSTADAVAVSHRMLGVSADEW